MFGRVDSGPERHPEKWKQHELLQERHRRNRIGWAFRAAGISLFVTLAAMRTIDRAEEGVLVAILAGLLGLLLRKEAVRRKRRRVFSLRRVFRAKYIRV